MRRAPPLACLAVLAAALLGLAARPAGAGSCPADELALWTGKHLRGANVFLGRNPGGGPNGFGDGAFAQSDFDDLAQAGANYVHLSHAGVFAEDPPYDLDPAAEASLDEAVARAAQAGLYVGIAMRSGPGRNEAAISNRGGAVLESIWTDAAAQDAWVAMLGHVAARYRNAPNVVGYSVMVEPNSYARHGFVDPGTFYANWGGTLEDVNGLYGRATAAIRAADPDTPILLEPEGYGNVAWLPYLEITGDARTVYTPHDYSPFEYTHELVPGASYPGFYDLDGDGQAELVDAAALTAFLSPMAAFSQQHGVPVAMTEFGVHVTADNAAGYLADRIAIQDAIGSWAVWTWQPAGFLDPFSVHDPSAARDALSAAWASNCTPPAAGDADGDGVPDAIDDCPNVADPAQTDTGGVGVGSGPDGVGDACQCGDVTGDGRVTLADAVALLRSELAPPTAVLARPELCDVSADGGCTLSDAVILRRALLSPPTAAIRARCGGPAPP